MRPHDRPVFAKWATKWGGCGTCAGGDVMRFAVLAVLFVAVAACAAGPDARDNWPHWRGPLANGTAPAADPPVTWDKNANVKWTADLPGKGSATPIVWG